MPNIKSAKKRTRQAVKRHAVNQARRSDVKTAIRKVVDALAKGDIAQSQELFAQAEAKIARAKNKGVLHANTAARKISRLAKRITAAAQ